MGQESYESIGRYEYDALRIRVDERNETERKKNRT